MATSQKLEASEMLSRRSTFPPTIGKTDTEAPRSRSRILGKGGRRQPTALLKELSARTGKDRDVRDAAGMDLGTEGARKQLRDALRQSGSLARHAKALSEAQQSGSVLQLLQHFQMPLFMFSQMASDHEQEARRVMDDGIQDLLKNETGVRCSLSNLSAEVGSARLPSEVTRLWRPPAPTPQAMVLANFITVPSPIAHKMMNYIAEDIVLYQSLGRAAESPHAGHATPTRARKDYPHQTRQKEWDSCEFTFPRAMRPFFLEMKVEGAEGIKYDRGMHRCRIPNTPEFRTSKTEYEVTMQGIARTNGLIPTAARKFVYLYPQAHATARHMLGGFLYLDEVDSPLQVNKISVDRRKHALVFGNKHSLPVEDADILRKEWHPISLPEQTRSGATHYAWFGPNEFLDGRKMRFGGFAYFFENPKHNCYFEVLQASQLVEYAGDLHVRQLTARLLPWKSSSADVEKHVTYSWDHEGEGDWIRGATVPVDIARLKVPGVIHPVVLRNLATNRSGYKVLSATAAKVIAQVVFARARWSLQVEILMEVMSLCCLGWLSQNLESSMTSGEDKYLTFWLMYWVLALLWIKNCIVDLCIMKAWKYWKPPYERFFEYFLVSNHLRPICYNSAMFLILTVVFVIPGHVALRPLVAIAAVLRWASILSTLANFEVFLLGHRILPILKALSSIGSFLIVFAFFFGACIQAWYAFCSDELVVIMQRVYTLVATQEFDENQDEDYMFLKTPAGSPAFWYHVQYGLFAVSSFIMTLCMANILIGKITSALDFYEDRADEMFVRKRIATGLDYTLCCQGFKLWLSQLGGLRLALWVERRWRNCTTRTPQAADNGYEMQAVWFCTRKDRIEPDREKSLRGLLNELKSLISDNMSSIDERLESLDDRLANVEAWRHKANRFAEVQQNPTGGLDPLREDSFEEDSFEEQPPSGVGDRNQEEDVEEVMEHLPTKPAPKVRRQGGRSKAGAVKEQRSVSSRRSKGVKRISWPK